MRYQDINAQTIDGWCREGWQWGTPIPHEAYAAAQQGQWDVYLTPTKPVPHAWFGPLAGKRLLGLASGEGVQFSHSVEEQIGGQLRAGFRLTDLYEDTTGYGVLQEYRVPTFLATRCVKDA